MKNSLIIGSVFLVFVLLSNCNQKESVDPESLQEYSVITDTLFITDEYSEVLVGRVSDISIGPNGSIYLLDSSVNSVKVFDENGNYLSEMLSGEGIGPGETINPNSIHMDQAGNLYVTDISQNKVLVLDYDNQLISEIGLSINPSKVVANNPGNIYVTGYRFSFSGDLIYHYKRTEENDYELVSTFAERGVEGESREVSMSGWSDEMSIDNEGNLYVGRFYPYHIDIYTADNELTQTIQRELDFITKPRVDRSSGMVTLTGVVREPLPLADGLLLIRYFKMDEYQNKTSYFDMFNSSGELISTRSFEELGISESAGYFISDRKNNTLYAGFNEPYPGLIRYKIVFN